MFEDSSTINEGLQDPSALVEAFIMDDYLHMDEEAGKQFLESAGMKALVEEGVVKKRTIIRLSKKDDYTRRLTLAAIQKAKEANSPEWRKLKKAQQMKKMALAGIIKRYGNSVKRDVVKAQRAVQKLDPAHYTRTHF